MGCGSCGTGKPNGCKGNGGCSSGGCNRLNVFDWLSNLPFDDPESNCKIFEVSFHDGSRKDFYRNTTLQHFVKGDYVTIEGVGGFDVGQVSLAGELVRLQLKKHHIDEFDDSIKRILRPCTEKDLDLFNTNKSREKEILVRARAVARQLNLTMKISEVEIQADGKKATFFYTADDRVDFRELIKMFASEFKVKVEMRQIGIRQEAGKVGGIGSCGRELCCSTWLTDFKSVTTTAARYQNLSINQTKLSGQCGRLKCCLNFELDTYLDALQQFPENADNFETVMGRATLIKKDIFKNLMWYSISGSNKQYPLTIERVHEIIAISKTGKVIEELEYVDLSTDKETVEVDAGFVDVVGQISLNSLDKKAKKKSKPPISTKNPNARNSNNRPNNNAPRRNSNDRPTEKREPRASTNSNGPKKEFTPRPNNNNGPRTPNSNNNTRPSNPQNKERRNNNNRPKGPRNNPPSEPK